jgi:hypothetical protein
MVGRGGSTPPSKDAQPATKGVAMHAQEAGQNAQAKRSAGVKQRAIALISAGACIGVAAIAIALSFLF